MEEQPHFEGTQLIVRTEDKALCYDARFLISILLVFVAKGDGAISDLESNKMIELLSSNMNIRSGEALEHLSRAVMILSNDQDILKTLQEISQGLSTAEKADMFSMALDVMVVDDMASSGETDAIKMVGQILGLSQDAIHAKLRSISSGG